MTRRLHLSVDLTLPLDAVTQTFAIVAKRRVGKTYTASVMAEEMIKAKLPIVVLDPTGAWWGLRASADGTKAGLPVIIIGGAHGDLPLEETSGKIIADLVVDHPGFYIVDLSQTASGAAQDRFVTDFAERLYRRKATATFPLHVFVDEADAFAPQKPQPGQQRMLGAIDTLIRRGGLRGIGMTSITQRPAVLNKNVLTQSETLIVLRITAPQDQDAVDDWIKRNGTKEERDEMMGALASLKKGEAYVWSPSWLEMFKRVVIRERDTFNSSATPEVGETRVEPKVLAAVDLATLRERLAETIEKVKADDPDELHKEIAGLKKQLRDRGQGTTAAATPDREVERRIDLAVRRELQVHGAEDGRRRAAVADEVSSAAGELDAILGRLRRSAERLREAFVGHASSPSPTPIAHERALKPPTTVLSSHNGISRPQQRMLNAMAQLVRIGVQRAPRTLVAALSDQSPSSSGFEKNMSTLRSAGWIHYPDADTLALTPDGTPRADAGSALLSLADLHAAVRDLVSGPQWLMAEALIGCFPDSMDRGALAAESRQSATSSGFEKNLSTLRSLGFIAYPSSSEAIATTLLMPEGLR